VRIQSFCRIAAFCLGCTLACPCYAQETPAEETFYLTLGFDTPAYQNPLGIEVAALDAALRAQLALEEGRGVLVTGVAPDSAVASAGLMAYDVVVALDDAAIGSPEAFQQLVGERQGARVTFHVLRAGKPATIEAELPQLPEYGLVLLGDVALNNVHGYEVQAQTEQYRLGVTLSEADDTLRSQLRLAAGEGLVVTDVMPDSPAAASGIRAHDVLALLDGRRLATVEAANAQIQEIQDRAVTVILYRGGEEVSLEVTPRLTAAEAGGWVRMLVELDGEHLQIAPRWTQVITEQSAEAVEEGAEVSVGEALSPEVPSQLAEIKRQVEALQAALQAFDAALQAAPAEAAPPTP